MGSAQESVHFRPDQAGHVEFVTPRQVLYSNRRRLGDDRNRGSGHFEVVGYR